MPISRRTALSLAGSIGLRWHFSDLRAHSAELLDVQLTDRLANRGNNRPSSTRDGSVMKHGDLAKISLQDQSDGFPGHCKTYGY